MGFGLFFLGISGISFLAIIWIFKFFFTGIQIAKHKIDND